MAFAPPILLIVVGGQTFWPFFSQGKPLAGAVAQAPFPQFDWKSLVYGKLARDSEAWFNQRLGFRPLWVRLENQINFRLFALSSRHAATRVLVGENEYLFKKDEVNLAFQPSGWSDAQVLEVTSRLVKLSEALSRRGIPLLLIIAPNKSEIYPEKLPAGWVNGRSLSNTVTDYERLRLFLDRPDLHILDAAALFRQWKGEGRHEPLFTRGGTHWSFAAALEVVREMRVMLNPLLKKPFGEITVINNPLEAPRWTDRDLTELCNLLDDSRLDDPTPFPVLQRDTRPDVDKPSLLVIGDSYAWNLLYWLFDGSGLCREAEMLYYCQTLYRYPGAQRQPSTPAEWDWPAMLSGHDAVVLVITEVAVNQLGYGFIETALPRLY